MSGVGEGIPHCTSRGKRLMVGGYELPLNHAFLHHSMRIVFKGRARDAAGTYLFADPDGLQVQLDPEEMVRLREKGQLRDWRPELEVSQEGQERRRGRVVHETATGVERAEADRRLTYCMAWLERPGTPRSVRGLEPIIAGVHQRRMQAAAPLRPEPPPPSASTLQKWLSRWLDAGKVGSALIPQYRLRGSDKQKSTDGNRRLIADFIDELYLTRRRHPISKVHRELVKHVAQLNKGRGASDQLPVPCYETVRQAVNDLCQYTVDHCRRGKAYADERWRAIGAGLLTTRANEVWEIDDTRVDVICVLEDGKTVVGRPWMVVVIDRHTRMLMGFVLTFSPPDTTGPWRR